MKLCFDFLFSMVHFSFCPRNIVNPKLKNENKETAILPTKKMHQIFLMLAALIPKQTDDFVLRILESSMMDKFPLTIRSIWWVGCVPYLVPPCLCITAQYGNSIFFGKSRHTG